MNRRGRGVPQRNNRGCHYLGAAKIMTPIGKAFAEAMVDSQKTQR